MITIHANINSITNSMFMIILSTVAPEIIWSLLFLVLLKGLLLRELARTLCKMI